MRLRTLDNQEYGTPQALFDELDAEFGFTLDVAASDANAKCPLYFTAESDGLSRSWRGERIFCNPPYNNIAPWIEKAIREEPDVAVFVVPARTHTHWFHEMVLDRSEIRWIRKKLRFEGAPYNAPEPTMIVIFRYDKVEP